MKIFGSAYDYLCPNQNEINQIMHPGNYIKSGNGIQGDRKIFFGVSYDDFEQSQLYTLKNNLQQYNIAIEFDDAHYLKFLYAHQFEMDKAIQAIKIHKEWLINPNTFDLNQKVLEILQKGEVYISSRDRKYRPLIVINAHLIDKNDPSSFLNALSITLIIVKQYMFFNGKVENWLIFIETNEISLFGFPFGALKKIIEFTSLQFPCCLEKIFIMNPSTSLQFSWSIIEKFINETSRKKIRFLQKTEFKDLNEYFEPEQLEEQYGGQKLKPQIYWPPAKNIVRESIDSISKFQKQNYQPLNSQQQLVRFKFQEDEIPVQQKPQYNKSNFQVQQIQTYNYLDSPTKSVKNDTKQFTQISPIKQKNTEESKIHPRETQYAVCNIF